MTQKVQKVFNRSEVVITNPLQAGRLWLYEEILDHEIKSRILLN